MHKFDGELMYKEGHIGLTFLLMSIIMLPFPYSHNNLIMIVMASALSALPDIDLEWQKQGIPIHHRGFTHSILFALICGIFFGGIFWMANKTLLWAGMGFISGFMAIVSHMIGDTFTYMAFKPLYPFDMREVSYGLCKASNKAVNEGLFTVGVITFILYFMLKEGILFRIL
jgi:inner membrane protein